MGGSNLPQLAVLADLAGSLSPTEIVTSAIGLATPVFLLDSRGGDDAHQALGLVARGLGPTHYVDFRDDRACLAVIDRIKPDAVITFVDRWCALAARLNAHVTQVGTIRPLWGRKDQQRTALRTAGLSRVRSARVRDETSLREFIADVGLPVVVKPTDGVASRDTWLIRTDADVAELARQIGAQPGASPGRLFAEEFIVGEPPAEPHLADYCSAEIFTGRPGAPDPFITDRLAPALPCRETGLLLPSLMPEDMQAQVLKTAIAAVSELDDSGGAYHVEIKPGRPRPEVIEVNGRLGGFISRLVRYGANADLGRAVISGRLGMSAPLTLTWQRCVLVLLYQAPQAAISVERTPSRRQVNALPGVLAVDGLLPAGSSVDWRRGSNHAAVKVWVAADDHSDLRARLIHIVEFLTDRFIFVTDSGRRADGRPWLEQISGSR